MTRFWLIRHGPTHANCMVGWADLPADLSDRAALARLEAALPKDAPLISSDLSRAVSTADAIAGNRRRLPHDPALREIHLGRWELRHFNDCEAEDPQLARAFWEDPGSHQAPEGESWDMLEARISAALRRLEGLAPDLVVVAHFGAILAAVQSALQVPAREVLAHRIENLSLTCIEFGPPGQAGKLHRLNHLP